MADNAAEIWTWLINAGYSPTGTAAIIGNLTQESLLNPAFTPRTDHGSQGLAQWRAERLGELISYARGRQLDPQTLEAQLQFLVLELQRDYSALDAELRRGTRSIESLTADFCWQYERPAKSAANLARRIAYAQSVYTEHHREPRKSGIVAAGGAVLGGLAAAHGQGYDVIALIVAIIGGPMIGYWYRGLKEPHNMDTQKLLDAIAMLGEIAKQINPPAPEPVPQGRATEPLPIPSDAMPTPPVAPAAPALPDMQPVINAVQWLGSVPWARIATTIGTLQHVGLTPAGIPAIGSAVRALGLFIPGGLPADVAALLPQLIAVAADISKSNLGAGIESGHIAHNGDGWITTTPPSNWAQIVGMLKK